MYRDDTPKTAQHSSLTDDLLKTLAFDPKLRPAVPKEVIERFERKRQRLWPGYAPRDGRELADWVQERVLLSTSEFNRIRDAMAKDHGLDVAKIAQESAPFLVEWQSNKSAGPLVAAKDDLGAIREKLFGQQDQAGGDLLHRWLQFYGPLPLTQIAERLGLAPQWTEERLRAMEADEAVVIGALIEGDQQVCVCDRENFESLLRMRRADARPEMAPLSLDRLPLFLARYQGITSSGTGQETLLSAIEQLIYYPLNASLWETEVFPARIKPYDPAWLDAAAQGSDLMWIGTGHQQIAFCYESELELLDPEAERSQQNTEPVSLLDLIRTPEQRFKFAQLLQQWPTGAADLNETLWGLVWQGFLVNDSIAALRQAIEYRFRLPTRPAVATARRRRRSYGRRRLKNLDGFALPGYWRRLPVIDTSADLLEVEERIRERVRILIDRYGIVFRELLLRELPVFAWAAVFKALRLMELAGELVTGVFFEGIPGPQFMAPDTVRLLQDDKNDERIFWINAVDPASVCGLGLPHWKNRLPKRLAGNHLVYRGQKLVLVSESQGRHLTIHLPPGDPDFADCAKVLQHMLRRRIRPLRQITIATINGEDAAKSPYVDDLRPLFDVVIDIKQVVLYHRP